MPIPVSNGLNKGIAFLQKCKKNIFQRSLFFFNRKRKKKEIEKFITAGSVLWVLEAF